MARLTLTALQEELARTKAELEQTRAQLIHMRIQMAERQAAFRLIAAMINDAMNPHDYERSDAALDDPPA